MAAKVGDLFCCRSVPQLRPVPGGSCEAPPVGRECNAGNKRYMVIETCYFLSRDNIPEPHRVVCGPSDKSLSVRRKIGARYRVPMPREPNNLCDVADVPQSRCLVRRSRSKERAVRREA